LPATAREYTGIQTVEELVYQGIKGLIDWRLAADWRVLAEALPT
jgi:hypothetical protein